MGNVNKKFSKTTDILNDLQDDGEVYPFYRRKACEYVANFLDGTNHDTTVAFFVCAGYENDSPWEPELYKQFPSKRIGFLKRQAVYEQSLRPLKKQREEISIRLEEIDVLLEQSNPINKKALEKEKAQALLSLIKVSIERDKLREPRYIQKYNTESTRYSREPINGKKKIERKNDVEKKDWDILREFYNEQANIEIEGDQKNPFGNLSLLGQAIGLSGNQIKLIEFMIVYEKVNNLESFFNNIVDERKQIHFNLIVARMTGVPVEIVTSNFGFDSPLLQYGLLSYFDDSERGIPTVSGLVNDLLLDPTTDQETIRSRFAGTSLTTDLDWNKDFGGLGSYGADILKLISHSYEAKLTGEKQPGPVIFFTGESDTGKTSAAAALVQELAKSHPGLELRVIGEKQTHGVDEDTGEAQVKKLTPEERLSQIMMAVNLAEGNPNIVFLIEEADSVLSKDHTKESSNEGSIERVVVQRLLEKNPATAIIFTTNHGEEIHPAVLRRGDEVPFRLPNRKQRENIIKRVLDKRDMTMPDDQIDQLARKYIVPAGKYATAIPKAKITAKGPNDYFDKICDWIERQALRDHSTLSKITPPYVYKGNYDLGLVNLHQQSNVIGSTMDINRVVAGLESQVNKKNGFAILLEGWPGTGKSEMIWMLGEKVNKDVLLVQRSDILDMYVGNAEKNLAKFFRQALEDDSILLIDELETLVRNRNGSNQGHEEALIGEFLSQMDLFKEKGGMIAATTNHVDKLDAAIVRRFEDHQTFDFLRPDQAISSWQKFFGGSISTDLQPRLQNMHRLTPADFAAVAKVAKRTDMIEQPNLLIAALEEREKSKPKEQQPKRRRSSILGFALPEYNNGSYPSNGNSPTIQTTLLNVEIDSWRGRDANKINPDKKP